MSEQQGVRRVVVWQCLHCKRYFEGVDEKQAQEMSESCYAQCQQTLDRAVIKEGMTVRTVRTEEETTYVMRARRIVISGQKRNSRNVYCLCEWQDEDNETHKRELQLHVLLPVAAADLEKTKEL